VRLTKAICMRCCRERVGAFWQEEGQDEWFERNWERGRVNCPRSIQRVPFQTMQWRITQAEGAEPPEWCPYYAEHVVSE